MHRIIGSAWHWVLFSADAPSLGGVKAPELASAWGQTSLEGVGRGLIRWRPLGVQTSGGMTSPLKDAQKHWSSPPSLRTLGGSDAAQRDQWRSLRTQVQSPAWHNGLKDQMWLSRNCGSDLIPGPGTPYATGPSRRKETTQAPSKLPEVLGDLYRVPVEA